MSRRARIGIAVLVGAIIAAGVGITVSVRTLEPRLRSWLTEILGDALQSEVTLDAVRLDWVPLRLHASGLTVRHHGRTDIPPLLVVASFMVDLRPSELWTSTLEHVSVDGLEITFPPKDENGKRPLPSLGSSNKDRDRGHRLVVKRLTAANARVTIIPRQEGKDPKVWDIFELDMRNLGGGEAATFTAALLNPIPYGKIESQGTFAWNGDEPGASPIAGEYTFAADLGTIEGLDGDLNAVGTMSGTIEQIKTTGETRTDEFRLTELDGAALPMQTSYEATVDGTKGDVDLHRVDVQLGASHFHTKGLVEGTRGVKGKRVVVNVKSDNADLAELLRFVSKGGGKPPASGRLKIDAAFDLPQGKTPVLQRVELEGSVRADRVRFSNGGVQDKIDELSRRAQGRPTDEAIDEVVSEMATAFSLRNGVLTYRGLSFNVTGASVLLAGTHSLRTKSVNLAGEVLLNATVSQTQTGIKRWLLKPFDPLFRKKQAGTRLVIKIEGTQDQPRIALDLGKTLKGR